MQFSVRRFVDPTPFIKCLHLDASQEQDTHEFSSLFNSYIQNKLNYENDKSIQKTINQQYCMKIAYIIKLVFLFDFDSSIKTYDFYINFQM